MEEKDKEPGIQVDNKFLYQCLGLVLRQWREAEVLCPRFPIEGEHDPDVFGQGGFLRLPAGKGALLFQPVQLFLQGRSQGDVVAVDHVGIQILFLPEMEAIELVKVIGRLPGHHEPGLFLVAVH